MSLALSPPPSPVPHARGQFTARVAENAFLCREHYRLVLRLASFPPTQPGQFLQDSCRSEEANASPEVEADWQPGVQLDWQSPELGGPLALLRRPFSLAGRVDGDGYVDLHLIHRVVGVGTDWLAHLKVNDEVGIIGPLGNRFTIPQAGGTALLVGGGVGIPPMLYVAAALADKPIRGIAFCGALSRDLLPLTITNTAPAPSDDSFEPLNNVDEFARHSVGAVISTDDGSYGFRGFVTQALERYLDNHTADAATRSKTIIYTCGPEPMMKRVADIAAARQIECQVAVERAMACGMGTCQSCCIRLKREEKRDGRAFAGKDWIYKLACTDGPVFKGADLLW
jgi:dihydroorotate dehydrogenase electron transfer subunit